MQQTLDLTGFLTSSSRHAKILRPVRTPTVRPLLHSLHHALHHFNPTRWTVGAKIYATTTAYFQADGDPEFAAAARMETMVPGFRQTCEIEDAVHFIGAPSDRRTEGLSASVP